MLRTPVCDLLGITHPVVLGGMAGSTDAELVAAVSNAGGLGVHGASIDTPDELRARTARIRELTTAPFGLNLLLFRVSDAQIDAVLAERPRVASFAWATPEQSLEAIFKRAHDAGVLVMHMASNVPEAVRAARAGADVIVAQGSEGGGHVGVMGTLVLLPLVVRAVHPKPVLAAGGIADGRGLAAALALGADGVLVGTRLLATPEAPIHADFKRAIAESDGHDTDLTVIPDLITGRLWPGAFSRVRRNALIRRWAGREWELRQRRAQVQRGAQAAAQAGDVEEGILFYGQDAGLIDRIEPAGEIVVKMVEEAREVLARRLRDFSDGGRR